MKLSEAILLGSVNNGQAKGALKDTQGNTCAMGAAFEAIGETLIPKNAGTALSPEEFTACQSMHDRSVLRWPILKRTVANPVTGRRTYLQPIIVDLNNNYGWTRPQIAAWVATLEQQMEAQAHPQAEVSEKVVA